MKNTLTDLNEYLFSMLDTITNDDLVGDQLDNEIKRAEAVVKVAKEITDNGTLALQAMKHLDEYGRGESVAISILGIEGK